jgi:hypothetical protein
VQQFLVRRDCPVDSGVCEKKPQENQMQSLLQFFFAYLIPGKITDSRVNRLEVEIATFFLWISVFFISLKLALASVQSSGL